MEEEYHEPTLEELREKRAALKAAGGPTHMINTLINQQRPAEDIRAEIERRKTQGKPTDRLEAELFIRSYRP